MAFFLRILARTAQELALRGTRSSTSRTTANVMGGMPEGSSRKGRQDSEKPRVLTGFNPGSGVWTFFAAELANIKPGVEAWIAAQRLNRLAQVL